MPSPSYTYSLTNGTTADASQVMQDFNDILNGVTDGTKDLSISALTCAGSATLNGNCTLGNASADDLTINASLASSLPVKTTNSYDIGSSSLLLRLVYTEAVNFGDTSLANYIQGTWTPAFSFSGGNGSTANDVTPVGHYTRIGNRVYINCTMGFDAADTATGSFTITGLPLTSVNTTNVYASGQPAVEKITSTTGPIVALIAPNTAVIAFYFNTSATTLTAVASTHMSATNVRIYLSMSYAV